MAGLLHRWGERWSAEQQEQDDLRARCADSGCRPIAEQPEGEVVTVHGVVRSIVLRPAERLTAVEAELDDGTATVTLMWLGRRRIAGIEPGRSLTASGRLASRGDGRVLYNPRYVLDAG